MTTKSESSPIFKRINGYFLESSQVWHFCLSDKSSKYMDLSTKNWRNYTDREKSKNSEGSLPYTIFSITKLKWTDLDLTHSFASGKRQRAREREKKLRNNRIVKRFLRCRGRGESITC
jgi:hypothetical protein